ncbi:MAG: metal ABC transporter solute-binding protein, Zn/Mn family, partial [Lentisphaeria bacterium]
LSLKNLDKIVSIMASHIIEKFPTLKETVNKNLKAIRHDLKINDEYITNKLAPLKGKTFYVYHPAFGYYAKDYQMIQKSVEIDGKTPSPKQILTLIADAKKDGVKTLLVQPQFNQKPAEIIAKRIDGTVVAINPLASDPIKELVNITNALINAYK